MIQSKDGKVWYMPPHGGQVILNEEDIRRPLGEFGTVQADFDALVDEMVQRDLDALATEMFPVTSDVKVHVPAELGELEVDTSDLNCNGFKLSFKAVEGAIGYRVYTGSDLSTMKRKAKREQRKRAHRIKQQRKARTGRR